MKYIHNATISCFNKETEDIEAIRQTIETFLPEDLEKEKIQLKQEHLKINEGEDLISLKVQTEKNRHNSLVLKTLIGLLTPEQKKNICEQDDRVDAKGNLFIRLDKKKLVEEGIAELVDHGNCVHFRFLLAAYPKNKAKALTVRDALFAQKNL